MTSWRVQRFMGYTYPRDWRWLWLRRREVPMWQSFAATDLSARIALNEPSTFDFRVIDSLNYVHNLVLDNPAPTP